MVFTILTAVYLYDIYTYQIMLVYLCGIIYFHDKNYRHRLLLVLLYKHQPPGAVSKYENNKQLRHEPWTCDYQKIIICIIVLMISNKSNELFSFS
jgi:hypothetical protein